MYRLVRSVLDRKFRIFRNSSKLDGSPDIYIPGLSLVLFVDGCFFHGCPVHGHIPKTNSEYWEAKIARNQSRDLRIRWRLRRDGYSVWCFWEHDLRSSAIPRTTRRML